MPPGDGIDKIYNPQLEKHGLKGAARPDSAGQSFSVFGNRFWPPGCVGFGQNATLQSDSQFYFGHIGFYGRKNQFFLVKSRFRDIKTNLICLIFTYFGI